MEPLPIDKLRLRFPGPLETEFRNEYFQKSVGQLRLGIVLGSMLYALFALLDVWIFPAHRMQTWFIRFVVVIPACLALLLVSYTASFKKFMQPAVFCIVLVAGAGIIAMMVIVQSPVNYFHFAGLVLVIMYSYTFSKLRFLPATVASWTIVGMYEISWLTIRHTPLPVFLNDNFFYIGANLIGMFSIYHRELYARRDFSQNRRVQELTEQVKRSLVESEGKFRTLAQTAAIAIFIHQGGNFLYANRAAEEIGGYSVQEYLGKNFLSLVHPDFVKLVKERAQQRLDGDTVPSQYEFKLVRKDGGERWVLMTAGTMEYEGRPAVIGTLIDVTDRKRAEEEKVRLVEERLAEEQRHRREKENILMDLHDGIGGITTNIGILAELARKAVDLEDLKKTLAVISQLAQNGIAEIRSFMRGLDSAELTWQSLAAECRTQGAGMLEPHGIGFSLESDVREATVPPDSEIWITLCKIYKEAITNVIKHAQAGAVTAALRVDGQGVSLSVQDDGCGAGTSRTGGRGLTSMRTRAAELGGRMTMVISPGTCIRVEIPFPLKYPGKGMDA